MEQKKGANIRREAASEKKVSVLKRWKQNISGDKISESIRNAHKITFLLRKNSRIRPLTISRITNIPIEDVMRILYSLNTVPGLLRPVSLIDMKCLGMKYRYFIMIEFKSHSSMFTSGDWSAIEEIIDFPSVNNAFLYEHGLLIDVNFAKISYLGVFMNILRTYNILGLEFMAVLEECFYERWPLSHYKFHE